MQALQTEVAAFGINTTIVNPDFFRTELLTGQSTKYANNPISDYTEKQEQLMLFWKSANSVATAEQVAATLHEQAIAYRELTSSIVIE